MKLFYIAPSAPGYAAAGGESKTTKKSGLGGFFGREKGDSKLKAKEEGGSCLAVFVAAKTHSRMNPMKLAARVRWYEDVWVQGGVDGPWGEVGKVAAFLALMAYGEKT